MPDNSSDIFDIRDWNNNSDTRLVYIFILSVLTCVSIFICIIKKDRNNDKKIGEKCQQDSKLKCKNEDVLLGNTEGEAKELVNAKRNKSDKEEKVSKANIQHGEKQDNMEEEVVSLSYIRDSNSDSEDENKVVTPLLHYVSAGVNSDGDAQLESIPLVDKSVGIDDDSQKKNVGIKLSSCSLVHSDTQITRL